MSKIYAAIDIGFYYVKIIVLLLDDEGYHILNSVSYRTKGVKDNKIIDYNALTISVAEALLESEKSLGLKLNKVILCVNPMLAEYKIVGSGIDNTIDIISGADVSNLLKTCLQGEINDEEEIVSLLPMEFRINATDYMTNPLGKSCEKLEVKAMLVSKPKKDIHDLISLLNGLGIEVIDLVLSSVADYTALKTPYFDGAKVVLINIGLSKTEITVFNKGIPLKSDVIMEGSSSVDNSLAIAYNLTNSGGRRIKEEFALANTRFASDKEIVNVRTKDNEIVTINQYEASQIVMEQLQDIFSKVKNKINTLTTREISYIILTGGICEIPGFKYLINETFSSKGIVGELKVLGVRHDKFTTGFGACLYFDEKMRLREKEYSMFDEDKLNQLVNCERKNSLSQTTILNKVFGYFKLNKEE